MISFKERKLFLKLLTIFASIFFILSNSCGGKKTLKEAEIFDPEKYISKAEGYINDNDFEEARKILLEVKNRDTSRKYAPLAQLKIAESYVKEGDIEIGVEEYRKFIILYPENQYASYAQYQIAMAYFSQIEAPDRGTGAAKKALEEFLLLKQLYPRNPFKDIIDLRIEKCRNIIADGEFMVGKFYYDKGSYNAAIKRFEGLLNQFPEYKKQDEVLLYLGKSYKALKLYDKAKLILELLKEKFSSSKFAIEAEKDLKSLKGS
jgi:outer membrane protein assembly factor BamD